MTSDQKREYLLKSYFHSYSARQMDLLEQSYTSRGEAFFHVSGAGHEGLGTLNHFLIPQDMLHCHYRDKALMLARGIDPEMFFLSLFNKDGSHSHGRQMNAHMSAPDLNIMSLVGPVGNSALQASGAASVLRDQPENPLVLCSLGDGMTQEGEVIEAIGQCVRDTLPVLFLVQNNSFAISTKTRGNTFFDRPEGRADSFYGIPITYIDGRYPQNCIEPFSDLVTEMRSNRKPRIIVADVDRLHSHTNADDHRVYRTPEEIKAAAENGDPVVILRNWLLDQGITEEELNHQEKEILKSLQSKAYAAQRSAEPAPVFDAKAPLPAHLTDPKNEYRGNVSPEQTEQEAEQNLTMLEAIRNVLDYRMEQDEQVTLFGEDIADPKGDVFGVTRGLGTKYPGRVNNSALSESLILGHSIGTALAGKRPVAFLQFADFLPIAFNQIVSELGSMYWRTGGGWQAPVIVMITCGGYKPGLGPFHASSFEAVAAHTPGVDVFMPSSAGDAAGLLNAAFESRRPTLFFYPKSCLNDPLEKTTPDIAKQLVIPGFARTVKSGDDITFAAYGNTVKLCSRAADELANYNITSDIIDLRSLVPWDQNRVIESTKKTGKLIIVHEDNHTAGFGAEIAATVAENIHHTVSISRVTRGDTYVPCNFANQLEVLPSYKRILETAVSMLGGTLKWNKQESQQEGIFTLEGVGSSPSDESITVLEWKVKTGESVKEGDLLAEMEADKAAFELESPVSGTIKEFLLEDGDTAAVGTPILTIDTGNSGEENLKPVTREEPGTPVISGLDTSIEPSLVSPGAVNTVSGKRNTEQSTDQSRKPTIGITAVASAHGSRIVTNQEIESLCPDWKAEDIEKRTGIRFRRWIKPGENALTLALDASSKVLRKAGLTINEIDAIICATGTPIHSTPSTASLIHNGLTGGNDVREIPAYDISAACSGYLYGLQNAYDFLSNDDGKRVLLVTTETLSKKLDTSDMSTAPIFGDAATATIVSDLSSGDHPWAEVIRPSLSARGEAGEALRVPVNGQERVFMDGPKVFLGAVKSMINILEKSCSTNGIVPDDLDLIIPHQANQRIINAIRQKLKRKKKDIYSNIAEYGNTSSCTIPICLEELIEDDSRKSGELVGLTAFGGGFTYAGGILKIS